MQVRFVLIRPEPVDLFVGLGSTQHAASRRGALLDRVLPMLDAQAPFEHRMVVIGHITRGVDPIQRRSAVLVHENAVLRMDSRAGDEIHIRFDPDTHDGEIAGNPTTAFRDDTLDSPASFERGHGIFEDGLDAMVAMDLGDDLSNLFAEHAKQGRSRSMNNHDLDAHLTKGGGDFGADEPHSDHDRLPARNGFRANGDPRRLRRGDHKCPPDHDPLREADGFGHLW